jgi:Homeodomain-like domain
MEKYRVTLAAEERAALEQLVSKGKAAARKLIHARVLLLADDSQGGESPDEEIVAALGTSPRTVARVRRRLVTEGFQAALDHRPQPARPDKIKIRGDVEQKLVELACIDPPKGRCRWTLQLLADEMVVLGLVDAISLETVRQALKKTTSSRGSSRPGASRRTPMPSSSGAWRTCSRPTDCLTTRDPRWSASTRRAGNSSARCGRPAGGDGANPPGWTTSTSGRGCATNS